MSLRKELRELGRLALPVVLGQTGLMMMGVVDTMVVGRVSPQALAAVALGNLFSWSTLIFAMGILHSLDSLVSQAHGAGMERTARHYVVRGLVVAVGLTFLCGGLSLYGGDILVWAGQEPALAATAQQYLDAIIPSIPAHLAFVVFRQATQARGKPGPVVMAVIVGNVANLVFDIALVYGKWGMPALGPVGSAWATTGCRYLMLLVLVLLTRKEALPLDDLDGVWERAAFWKIFKIGVPIGVQFGLEVWVFSISSLLIGQFGAVSLSGHQIALNLASLSFMVPLGIGAAAAARVGNAIGAGDGERARLAAKAALLLGGGVMVVSAAAFVLFPTALATLYTGHGEVIAVAATLLPLAAIFQIFDGTQAVAFGVLRGAADTRIPTAIYIVGFWIVGLPTGYVSAFRLGYQTAGIWYGFIAGLAAVAVLAALRVAWRFRPGVELKRIV